MSWLSDELTRALGLTLLDSLWQGALVILLCAIVLTVMRGRSAQSRFRVVLAAIIALPVLALISFTAHYEPLDQSVTADSAFPISPNELIFEGATANAAPAGLLERWQAWAEKHAAWVTAAWLIGISLFALRMLGGFYWLYNLKSRASIIQDSVWLNKLQALGEKLSLKTSVVLKESARVSSPVVMGYVRPMIIFPMGLIQGLPTDQVEAILLHELAHIKRHDYLLNLVVSLLQVVFFYHPAYWWLQHQLDQEREFSCDDLVLSQSTSPISLIKALTAVREFQVTAYNPSLGFASRKNQLLKRVERIMNKKSNTHWTGGLVSVAVLLLSFSLMSYQSGTSTNQEEPVVVDSAKMDEVLPIELDPPAASNLDSLTVDQAVMHLLNSEQNQLILEIGDNGKLYDVTRDGKQVSKAELQIYKLAYQKLRVYSRQQQVLDQKLKIAEREILLSRREQLRLQLLKEIEVLQQRTSEKTEQEKELERRITALELELREIEVRESKLSDAKSKRSYDLDELLELHPTLILKYKNGAYDKWRDRDSLYFSIPYGLNDEKVKRFTITIEQLDERLKLLERTGQPLEYNTVKIEEYEERIAELRALEKELLERGSLTPGKFEFAESEYAQRIAAQHLAKQSKSIDRVLLVVDGEIKEDWTIQDLERIDNTRQIKSVTVTPTKSVTEERYLKYLINREGLMEVTTRPGKKGFTRPSIEFATPLFEELTEKEIDERYADIMLKNLNEDGLVKKGWERLELQHNGLYIDGKKQSKKLLKKYLKLYEELAGKPMPKGKKIEVRK